MAFPRLTLRGFKMPQPALIIFDCDGVLVDSEVIAAKLEREFLNEHDVEIGEEEHYRRFTGLNFSQTLKLLEDETGRAFPDDLAERFEAELDSRLWRDVNALPGSSAVLDELDQPRCICSNSSDERLKITLTKTGLWDRFRPYVFSAHSLPGIAAKPAPDIFLYAARELQTNPGACVVVEDSVHGVTSAVSAGMRVIGYTGGSHSRAGHGEQLIDAGAETVIKNLFDVRPVVEAFSKWDGLPA